MPRLSKFPSIVGLVLIASIALSGCSSLNSVLKAPTPIPYQTAMPTEFPARSTAVVERGDIVRMGVYPGRIVSKIEKQIQFQTGGVVEQVLVQQGELVKKGQILARLHAKVSEFDIKKAEIALERAKLVYQQTELNTSQFQVDYDVILGLKKTDIDLAQVQLDELKRQLEDSTLAAPADGLISELTISDGDEVKAFTTVMLLSDPGQLEISTTLPAGDLNSLVENQPVRYNLTNDPATVYTGLIKRLPLVTTGSTNSGAAYTDSLRISLDPQTPLTGLKIGAPVQIQIEVENHTGVLLLPANALVKVGYKQFVYLENDGAQTQVEVEVGITTTDKAEIKAGLTEGQVVLLP